MFRTFQPLLAMVTLACFAQQTNSVESALQQKDGLTAQLVTDVPAITPGELITIDLIMDTEEGYHTYWKGPGIVGVATNLTWTLPEGFSAGEIIWPAPERVDMVGINAHGYNRKICLLTEIQVPDIVQTNSVTLKAKAAWMCCATSCYPGFTDLKLTLPVNQSGEDLQKDAQYTKLFQKSRASVPPIAPDNWTIAAKIVTPEVIELEVTIPELESMSTEDVYFFAHDLQVNSEEPQLVTLKTAPNPTLKFSLTHSDFAPKNPEYLGGVIYHPGGWPEINSRHTEISFAWPTGTFQP